MGPRTHATVAYLSGFHHIPEGRIAHILQHLYGLGTCGGTVGSIITRVSEKLTGFRDHLLATVYAAGVVHLDETGIKVSVDGKAKCYWLHVACTPKLACFRVDSRGEVFNPGRGTIVHDCLGSYFGLPGVVRHGLCGQHILRELKSIIDQSNEPWARKMRVLLKRANHAINDVIRMLEEIDKEERAKPNATQAERDDFAKRREAAMAMMRECERSADSEYDAVLKEAIEYHESLPAFSNRRNKDGAKPKNLAKRKGHALAERLVAHKAMVLLFTQDLTVPFTNNTAEQALRMAKVRMKVSGCFRTLLGAENFAILRSVIVTAQRQGWNLIETLLAPPAELIAKLVSA